MRSDRTQHKVQELIDAGVIAIGDGYRAKNIELGENGLPFARAANVNAGLQLEEADHLLWEWVERAVTKRSRPGDVVFTSKGTVGRFAFVRSGTEEFVYSPQLCFWRVLDKSVIEPRYLYYWMHGRECEHQFNAAKGSTDMADYISLRDQRAMTITFPPLEEQRRIAQVLGALDDKIESNRGLAETLEETAAALFEARFIDFVGHDDLVASEIGQMPRGWSIVDIYELASVTYGRPFKSSLFDDSTGVPLLRIRDLATHEPQVRTTELREDGRLIKAGDIVVGMDGEFRAHVWSGPDSWLNQRVCAFDPLPGISQAFVLGAIKRPLAFFEATKSGTTVIHLGKGDIDTFRIVRPPNTVMAAFCEEADPLLLSAVAARRQARTLAAIRDGLLPRLVSGQLHVPPDEGPALEVA